MKSIDEPKVLKKNSIKVISVKDYYLLPVSNFHLKSNKIIHKLTKWRNQNSFAFIDKKKVTFKSTKTWLKKRLLENEKKILFLIVSKSKDEIGHLGLDNFDEKDNSIEIDNVIKGINDKKKNISSKCLITIMKWSQKNFMIKKFKLKVLASNLRAIKFYYKNNFEIKKIIRLKDNKDFYYLMQNYL